MYKIHIGPKPGTIVSDVFIYSDPGRSLGDVGSYLTIDNGEVISHYMRRMEGTTEDIKPAFTIDEMTLRELLAGFAQAAKDRGIQDQSETFVKGKLEATENHLADMRELVFKKTK